MGEKGVLEIRKDETNCNYTIKALDKLRGHANLGKHKHFYAADRANCLQVLLDIPVIVINIILGSVFFLLVTQDIPIYAKWCGAFLALIATVLSGLRSFLNLQRTFEGHRKIGNKYLAIERSCERVQVKYLDGLISIQDVADDLTSISLEYQKINIEAEEFPTRKRDYKFALNQEKEKNDLLNCKA